MNPAYGFKLASELLRQATGIFSIVRSGKLFHALLVEPNRVSVFRKQDIAKPIEKGVESDDDNYDDTDSDDTDTEGNDEDCNNEIVRAGRRQLVQEHNSSIGMYELLKAEGKL